jgi:hypothetical protein
MLPASSITHNLGRLRSASARLNAHAHQVEAIIGDLETALRELNFDLAHVHPHPIEERAFNGPTGKRVIEIHFLGFMKIKEEYRLGIKTLKILESTRSMATERPGELTPLVQSAVRLQHCALDFLPALVLGITTAVERAAEALATRCKLLKQLRGSLTEASEQPRIPPGRLDRNSARVESRDGVLPPQPPKAATRKIRERRNTPTRVIVNRVLPQRRPPAP